MKYLVVAYPELKQNDFELIQQCRKNHDNLFPVIEPHFTLVFGVDDFQEETFVQEIKNKTKNAGKINFTLRCACVSKDIFKDQFNVFLVPDEGFSKVVKLHNHLYSGLLTGNLRFDLDFIPHITIGNSADHPVSKKMADEWNAKDFSISGTISTLTIVSYENNCIRKLHELKLS